MIKSKIVFYNHFHRGDLFTHKEFIRQIIRELPKVNYSYWHYNHPKVNLDLEVPVANIPSQLSKDEPFYEAADTLAINTWIGCHKEIFAEHGGVNLQSLCSSWKKIFDEINMYFGCDLVIKDQEEYLPTIDYGRFDLGTVNDYVLKNKRKKILICNGRPMSNQSFESDLEQEINDFAQEFPDYDFICTKKIVAKSQNILSTDEIIKDNEQYSLTIPWNDRPVLNCDLNEISYLSRHCNAIIGKNSGPFVFCETRDNFMDEKQHILSFSNSPRESMSNGVKTRCWYKLVTDHSPDNIKKEIKELLEIL